MADKPDNSSAMAMAYFVELASRLVESRAFTPGDVCQGAIEVLALAICTAQSQVKNPTERSKSIEIIRDTLAARVDQLWDELAVKVTTAMADPDKRARN